MGGKDVRLIKRSYDGVYGACGRLMGHTQGSGQGSAVEIL